MTYTRRRPLRFTCPASGVNSPVSNLISVDFPAPFAPTTAILESNPTSIFTLFNTTDPCFSLPAYPKVTSESCNSGGEIFNALAALRREREEAQRKQ